MTVYILFNDCPSEFNDKSILAVYSNKKRAEARVETLKRRDAYAHQYLTILKKVVWSR